MQLGTSSSENLGSAGVCYIVGSNLSVGLSGDVRSEIWLAFRMDNAVDGATARQICVIPFH